MIKFTFDISDYFIFSYSYKIFKWEESMQLVCFELRGVLEQNDVSVKGICFTYLWGLLAVEGIVVKWDEAYGGELY